MFHVLCLRYRGAYLACLQRLLQPGCTLLGLSGGLLRLAQLRGGLRKLSSGDSEEGTCRGGGGER